MEMKSLNEIEYENQNNSQDEKEKKYGRIVLLVFVLMLVSSVATTYYRIFVKRDYTIAAEMDCDPLEENCYVWECDPAVDGEDVCTGDPEDDIWYYKIIDRKAFNIPLCDPNDEDCDALDCPEGEENCTITNCDPETEDCMTPEQYIEENPDVLLEDEEAMECEEGDEECLEEESDAIEEGEAEEGLSIIEESGVAENQAFDSETEIPVLE